MYRKYRYELGVDNLSFGTVGLVRRKFLREGFKRLSDLSVPQGPCHMIW